MSKNTQGVTCKATLTFKTHSILLVISTASCKTNTNDKQNYIRLNVYAQVLHYRVIVPHKWLCFINVNLTASLFFDRFCANCAKLVDWGRPVFMVWYVCLATCRIQGRKPDYYLHISLIWFNQQGLCMHKAGSVGVHDTVHLWYGEPLCQFSRSCWHTLTRRYVVRLLSPVISWTCSNCTTSGLQYVQTVGVHVHHL